MGLFDGQSTAVEDITVGFDVPVGEYEFEITGLELKGPFEKGKIVGQSALVVELTVVSEGPAEGMSFDHFLILPNQELQDSKRLRQVNGFLKQALLWYGVPESRLATFNPDTDGDALIGQRGLGVLKKSGEFTNLTSFELTNESGVSNTDVSATVAGADLTNAWAS